MFSSPLAAAYRRKAPAGQRINKSVLPGSLAPRVNQTLKIISPSACYRALTAAHPCHALLQPDKLTGADMATYGYCRVSTARQANEGESLDVQRRQIEGYALMHGMAVDEILVEEGVSGSVPVEERPIGSQLFAKLQRGDIVIAAKLDRLFRSALDALKVVESHKAPASSFTCWISAAISSAMASRSCF